VLVTLLNNDDRIWCRRIDMMTPSRVEQHATDTVSAV
jgi:hypothetical protein